MIHSFAGEGVNDVYAEMVQTVMTEGAQVPSRVAPTYELHPALVELSNPRRRLVTAHGRPINVAFALAEVLWIITGRQDVEMLKFYNSTIDRYSDDGETFNAAYGYRLRTHFGFDQIDDAVALLRKDPGTRQAVLSIWSPPRDRAFTRLSVVDESQHVPNTTEDRACNIVSHLMIRDGALDWLQIVRSNDLLWGTPYNWMQFTHLQEYIATLVGVPVGRYIHVADSLHIYDYHWEEAKSIQHFDLYEFFGDHDPMDKVDPVTIGIIADAEARYRIDRDAFTTTTFDPRESLYWLHVLHVLHAHADYVRGEDDYALTRLNLGDGAYAAAQCRFYYQMRWHKPGYEGITTRMEEMFGPAVIKWIKHRAPANANS